MCRLVVEARIAGVLLGKVMAERVGNRCGAVRLMTILVALWITGVVIVRVYNTCGVTTAGVEGGAVHEVNCGGGGGG